MKSLTLEWFEWYELSANGATMTQQHQKVICSATARWPSSFFFFISSVFFDQLKSLRQFLIKQKETTRCLYWLRWTGLLQARNAQARHSLQYLKSQLRKCKLVTFVLELRSAKICPNSIPNKLRDKYLDFRQLVCSLSLTHPLRIKDLNRSPRSTLHLFIGFFGLNVPVDLALMHLFNWGRSTNAWACMGALQSSIVPIKM